MTSLKRRVGLKEREGEKEEKAVGGEIKNRESVRGERMS